MEEFPSTPTHTSTTHTTPTHTSTTTHTTPTHTSTTTHTTPTHTSTPSQETETEEKKKGRPTLLESEIVRETILTAIRRGTSKAIACKAASVAYGTLKYWQQKGRLGKEPYATFLAEMKRADAECEQRCAGILYDAGPKSWQAAIVLAERRWPKRWARPEARTPPVVAAGGEPVSMVDFEKWLESRRTKWREEWEQERAETKQ